MPNKRINNQLLKRIEDNKIGKLDVLNGNKM